MPFMQVLYSLDCVGATLLEGDEEKLGEVEFKFESVAVEESNWISGKYLGRVYTNAARQRIIY